METAIEQGITIHYTSSPYKMFQKTVIKTFPTDFAVINDSVTTILSVKQLSLEARTHRLVSSDIIIVHPKHLNETVNVDTKHSSHGITCVKVKLNSRISNLPFYFVITD